MSEQKKCPFCGSEGKIYENSYDGKTIYSAGCSGCGAVIGAYENKQSAIEAWNNRVDLVSENDEGLLSCPCCGGNARVNEITSEGHVYYYVMCDECLIHTRGRDNEHDVVALWNKRINDDKTKANSPSKSPAVQEA